MKYSKVSDKKILDWFKSIDKVHLDKEVISKILNSHVVTTCEVIDRVMEQKPFLANAIYDEYSCTEFIMINLIDDTSIVINYTYDI